MARRMLVSAVVAVTTFTLSIPNVYAADSSSPSPSANPSTVVASPVASTHRNVMSGQKLTAEQKAGLNQAKKNLAAAIHNAKSTFNLFSADAQANRDQAILAAGSDKNAKRAALAEFRSAMSVAKSTMQSAIAQANLNYANALKELGITEPTSK